MTIQTIRLACIALTVADLGRAERFYVEALGFHWERSETADPAMAALLGADRIHQSTLRRGEQSLVLQSFEPPGAPYPTGARACDAVFQHFAMPVADIAAAYAWLAPFAPAPISSPGPQALPARSGGAVAYKFRDPDGHPLELIQFPQAPQDGGIHHSAIAVADTATSIAFYRDRLGFGVAAQQVNTGPEQDRLDGLDHTTVDVVALVPEQPAPHVELLGYHAPPGRPAPLQPPCDIAATRLILEVTGLPDPAALLPGGVRAAVMRDPDAHLLLLLEYPATLVQR